MRFKKLVFVLLCGMLGFSLISDGLLRISADDSNGEYTVERISHPDRQAGQVDGILTGENEDRGNSYAWSMEEAGDSIYIGTCYNPIYGIFYRAFTGALQDTFKEDTKDVVTSLIRILYGENFYENQVSNPAIIKVNKKTGEATLLYRYKDANPTSKNMMSGFRMAASFKGKLYFVGSGYPTYNLLEIDPETDTVTEVYKNTMSDYTISSGIHGLTVYNDQLVMAVSEDVPSVTAKIYASSNPSEGMSSWTAIADSSTFKNYPKIYIKDGINGGGIWDLCVFNNELYATMITDSGEDVLNKKGFAMFKGSPVDGVWSWTEIIGNTDEGAWFPFGLSMSSATTANLHVYNNNLYIGNYNDPMLDLAILLKGEFGPLYNDLTQSINLYRMNGNGDIDLVAGQANETFPEGPIGNLGTGLGSPMNQYVWDMETYEGKLYVGTYDTSTITNAITQLTNGDLIKDILDKDKFSKLIKNIKDLISIVTKERSANTMVDTQTVDDMSDELASMDMKVEGVETRSIDDKDLVDHFKEFKEMYDSVKDYLPTDIREKVDALLPTLEKNSYYLAISNICSKAEKGFDLLASADGVNFNAVTRNGFNDPYNHGARTLKATKEGLFIGTANPFWGTQLWKLEDVVKTPEVNPTSYVFYKNEPVDYVMDVNYNGTTLETIYYGDMELTYGVDYDIVDNQIILKKEFMDQLEISDVAYNLTLQFSHSKSVVISVLSTMKVQDKFTVTFETMSDDKIDPLTNVEKGSKISKPRNPKREGFVFEGWYVDAELKNAWNFEKDEVNSDITLYAKWTKKTVSTGDTTKATIALSTLIAAFAAISYASKKRKEQ